MTVSAKWREEGKEDPHGNIYNQERSRLTLGHLTDDELANAVFLYGDNPPNMEDVLAGRAKMPIVYLTAAKERIRWLSRRLEDKLGTHPEDLLWNQRGDGRFPKVEWTGFDIIGLEGGLPVAIESAEMYRVMGYGPETYWLHVCLSYSEALSRLNMLRRLL